MPAFRLADLDLPPLPVVHILPLLRRLRSAGQRYRQRRALAELDDRLLADVGITRREAERECRKPPWR